MAKPRIRWTTRGWFKPVIYVVPWIEAGGFEREYRLNTMLGPFKTAAEALAS